MSMQEITEAVLELPEKERLEVARRILASLEADQRIAGEIAQAVRETEDVITGKVRGLTEAEFRDALR